MLTLPALKQYSTLLSSAREVVAANRFYQLRLSEWLNQPDLDRLAPKMGLARFRQSVPFTTKPELVDDQIDQPPFGTNLTYPISAYTRFHQTSGTSGRPLRWLDTPESWSHLSDTWWEVFCVSGVTEQDRIFFAFSFGPFLGFWTAFDAGLKAGCLCIPGGGMSSSARLQAIRDNGATVLCCTPTYAIRLGEVAREDGIDLSDSSVRLIIVAGEPGASVPATRRRIEEIWPTAKLKDHHGMTETGPVTYECPERIGVLHIHEAAFIPEIIDPVTTEPVEHGGQGELVLTNLLRTGSPLFRYRTGDLVQSDNRDPTMPCACGRSDMALPGGILGRTDDMVVVRGVNLHPSAVEAIVRSYPEIEEFRVDIDRRNALVDVRVQIELNPSHPDPATVSEALERAFRAAFNLRIPVESTSGLPRFEMKAKRWVIVQ